MERLVLWHRTVPPSREEATDHAAFLGWTRSVAVRMRAAGATLVGRIGSTVACAFDPADLGDALDLALELLDESQRTTGSGPSLPIALGAALGDVASLKDESGEVCYLGPAVERAQALSGRARAGDLVVDQAAREAAAAVYLFSRTVAVGGGPRGYCVDRSHPRRESCRLGIRHLHAAPVPPTTRAALHEIEVDISAGETRRILLRGPGGAGAQEWVDHLEREIKPPMVLRVRGTPGALEPLGSLRLSLLGHFGSPDDLAGAAIDAGEMERQSLVSIAKGDAVSHTDAVAAVVALLRSSADHGRSPWIVADPLSTVDPASISVLAAATQQAVPSLFVARMPVEARVPAPLLEGLSPVMVTLPALRMPDARVVAEAVLGPATTGDVARRVAVLGGDSPLGVVEAARALIASGDLVRDGDAFSWRVGPRGGVTAIPVDTLIEERLSFLEQQPLRMLEIVCVAPDGAPLDVIEAVATMDGLDARQRTESIERLQDEALVTRSTPHRATSTLLRAVVAQSMPPSRISELHRFTAEGLRAQSNGAFARATVGFYLAEGGLLHEGAKELLEASRAAATAGFSRAALRLAAAAVQFDRSVATKSAATHVSRAITREVHPEGGITIPPEPRRSSSGPLMVLPEIRRADPPSTEVLDVAQGAIRAIRAKDFDAVERFLDIAVAEGRDRSAADRVRAMAHLARGDLQSAARAFAQAKAGNGKDGGKAAREDLALALLLLHSGAAHAAVREGLRALSKSRETGDAHGEAAALSTLSACYRALGCGDEAAALELAVRR